MIRSRLMIAVSFVMLAVSAVACGGGSTATVPGGPTAVMQSILAPVSVSTATTVNVPIGGLTAAVTLPAAASGGGTVTVSGSAAAPTGVPALSLARTTTESVGTANLPVPLAYVTLTTSATDTFATFPTFVFTLPAGTATTGEVFGLAYLQAGTSWITPFAGPGTVTLAGTTPIVSFPASSVSSSVSLPVTLQAGVAAQFALYQIAGTAASPSPTPSAGATALPTVAATPGCSSTGTAPTICSIAPASGAVGSTVLINGSNFVAPLSVSFSGGVNATGSFTATQVTAVVPAGAQSGPITITTANGSASSTTFTVTP